MTDQDPTQHYETPPIEPVPTGVQPAGAPSAIEPPAPPPAPEAVIAAPTTPVSATPTARPGRSRIRWLIAAVVTLFVVGTAAGATLLLTRESGDPDVLAWAPADSVVYTEARLDLPGSQEAELAKVMSAFPGFDDQAAFTTKLNEALDQLVKRASNDKMSYTADVEPWFGGQVSMSVGPLPTTADPKTARALLLADVTDTAKAKAWADKLLADTGATTSTETYNNVTITTVTPPAGSAVSKTDMTGAYALFGPVIAVGDPTSIKAAIDTGGKTGLPTNAQFKTAAASVSGDRLAFLYVDSATLAKGAKGLAGDVGAAMPSMPAVLNDLTVPWFVGAVRADNGAFVVDTRSPHNDKLGAAKAGVATIPSTLPPTTVAYVGGHDLGLSLEQLKTLAGSDPELADGVKQIDDALKIVGGFGSLVDWMGETGVAITRDGDAISGGVLVVPTDPAAADKLFTQLRGFLALAGGSSGIKVTDETYNGATITTVDLGDAGSLLGMATGGSGLTTGTDLTIAYTVTDKVVVLGYGADFVKAVLDAGAGDSLADTQRFGDALSRVDKENGSLAWVDVSGIRDLVESKVPASDKADYEANVKPYLQALDYAIGTQTPGADVDSGTLVITVRNP